MTIRILLPVLLMSMLMIACNKKDDKCNYGVLRLNFATSNMHNVFVVIIPPDGRDKDIPAGVTTDTLHLEGGASYSMGVSSHDANGNLIQAENFQIHITNCEETVQNIPF